MISFIDLQIGNYCNRSCWFCPPQEFYKPKNSISMTIDTLKKVLEILKNGIESEMIAQDANICFNRYCEPSLYTEMLDYAIDEFRDVFPKGYMCIHSNGDLLTDNFINIITKFNCVTFNRYDNDSLECRMWIIETFGFDIEMSENEHLNLFIFYIESTRIKVYYQREYVLFKNNLLKSRGSIVEKLNISRRIERCYTPMNMIAFDVNGDIFPCSDVHGSIDKHLSLKIGNVSYINNFNEIYNKLILIDYRNHESCKYCTSNYDRLIPIKYRI